MAHSALAPWSLQVAENMLWVWGESGPASFIDSAAKQPAVTRVSVVSIWREDTKRAYTESFALACVIRICLSMALVCTHRNWTPYRQTRTSSSLANHTRVICTTTTPPSWRILCAVARI